MTQDTKSHNTQNFPTQKLALEGNHKRWNTSKCCWSHGAWAHHGKTCRNKKDGHRDEASFNNELGGSLDFCSKNKWLLVTDNLECIHVKIIITTNIKTIYKTTSTLSYSSSHTKRLLPKEIVQHLIIISWARTNIF